MVFIIQRHGSLKRWSIFFTFQWCPPCMRLLPEYRKAARSFDDSEVGFGTVDCTIHINLCHMVSMFYLSTGASSSVSQLVSRKGNLHFSIQESFTATTQYFPSLRCPHHVTMYFTFYAHMLRHFLWSSVPFRYLSLEKIILIWVSQITKLKFRAVAFNPLQLVWSAKFVRLSCPLTQHLCFFRNSTSQSINQLCVSVIS